MKVVHFSPRAVVAAGLLLLGMGSCFAEPSGGSAASGGTGASGAGASMGGETEAGATPISAAGTPSLPACYSRPVVASANCRSPVKSLEPLHSKVIEGVAHDQQVFVDDLFSTFKSHCGACHVSNSLGSFQVTRTNFPQVVDAKVLSAIESDTEACKL